MASEKAAKVLRKYEIPMTDEEIEQLPEGEAWGLVRKAEETLRLAKHQNRMPQICFTGFTVSDKTRLAEVASAGGYAVKDSVTKTLSALIIGTNAGESKIAKARKQGCKIFSEAEFISAIEEASKKQMKP